MIQQIDTTSKSRFSFGTTIIEEDFKIPVLDMATMMPVLMGMLGLGAMRTVEKTKKVQRDR